MSLRPYRLLVVDDDPDIRDVLAINFTAEGFDVLTAADGNEAERTIRDQRPDVVILDIMMPERDGLEVLRSLRSDPATRDVNVVLLSAKSSDGDIFNGLLAGTDYYMTKPFNPGELVRYVWHVLGESGICAFGDAPFFGSIGNIRPNQPTVGMAGTPSGNRA